MQPTHEMLMLPAKNRLAALIFDMDGLMIDSEPLWWRVEHALAAAHGVVWSDEDARACIGTGLQSLIVRMQRRGLPLAVDAGVGWLVDTFVPRLAELELKPGFLELLHAAEAASLRLAVASSSTVRLIDAVLDRFALAPRFHAVISGETVPHPKPAPDIFLAAARALDVEPAHAVVLEDSLAGVRAAAAAQIAVIAVPEIDRQAFPALTPYVVDDLHQARALLELAVC